MKPSPISSFYPNNLSNLDFVDCISGGDSYEIVDESVVFDDDIEFDDDTEVQFEPSTSRRFDSDDDILFTVRESQSDDLDESLHAEQIDENCKKLS